MQLFSIVCNFRQFASQPCIISGQRFVIWQDFQQTECSIVVLDVLLAWMVVCPVAAISLLGGLQHLTALERTSKAATSSSLAFAFFLKAHPKASSSVPLITLLSTFWMQIPKLLYREATSCLPPFASGPPSEARSKWLHHRLSIFAPDNIHRSISHTSSDRASSASTSDAAFDSDVAVSGCFGFTRMLGLSPREVSGLAQATALERWAFYWQREAARVRRREIDEVFREGQEVS
jgi:hypothetical protein